MPDTKSVFISASDDIKVWNSENMQILKQYNYHESNIKDVAWNHDNSIIASTCLSGNSILLCEPDLKQSYKPRIAQTVAKDEQQTSVCFGSSPKVLYSGGNSGDINAWDDGKLIRTFNDTHSYPVTCLSLNATESHLTSSCSGGEVRIWNPGSGHLLAKLTDLKGSAIRGMEYSSWIEYQFGTASDDGALSLWDANKKVRKHTFNDAHHAPAMDLSYSPLNHLLLGSCGLDKNVVLYDMSKKKLVRTIHTDHPLTSMCFMADGTYICTGSSLGSLYKFDLRKTNEPLCGIHAHSSSIQRLVLHTLRKNTPKERSSSKSKTTQSNNKMVQDKKVEKSKSPPFKNNDVSSQAKRNSPKNLSEGDTKNKFVLQQTPSNDVTPIPNRKPVVPRIENPVAESGTKFEHGPDALAQLNTPGIGSNHSSFRDTLGSYCEYVFSPVAPEFRGETPNLQLQENGESFIIPSSGAVTEKNRKRGRSGAQMNAPDPKEKPANGHLETLYKSNTLQPSANSSILRGALQQKNAEPPKKLEGGPQHTNSPKFSFNSKQSHPPSPLTSNLHARNANNKESQIMTSQSSPSETELTQDSSSQQSVNNSLSNAENSEFPAMSGPENGAASRLGSSHAFQYQMEFLKNTVKHLIEEHEDNVRDHVNHLHLQIIKMVFELEEKMEKLAERCSVNPLLLEEIERLRIENDRLRKHH